MRHGRAFAFGAALFVALGGSVRAQFGAPAAAAPAAAAPAAAAPAAAAPAAAPKTLWSFLGLSKDNLAACKLRFCKSQLGLLSGNLLAPARTFSGGLLPQCCPPD